MDKLSPAQFCPAANICENTAIGGPGCGQRPEHLLPLPLAERLCPSALEGALEKELARKTNPDAPNEEAERRYRLGCLFAESAMVNADSLSRAVQFYSEAEGYLDEAANYTGARMRTRMEARLYAAGLPLLLSRDLAQDDSFISEELLSQTAANIAGVGRQVEDFNFEDEQRGFRVKVGFLLFILRYNQPAYVSSFREACIARDDLNRSFRQDNHAVYLVEQGDKLPFRLLFTGRNEFKKGKGRGSPALLALWNAIQQGVDDKAPPLLDVHDKATLLKHTVHWAINEAVGDKVRPLQTEILDGISEDLFSQVEELFP